ncbi:MAG: TRAFAC clade GTPase domain-containing protein [Gemmataceae bacterium]
MANRFTDGDLLLERLSRPQRIGVVGHRGVGKTTLLSVLYREAVSGRWPDLRLAAADTRTAQHLADKIAQLESGQPLPATLAETDLRFHLYRQGCRLHLLFKDYQGEHVELGRDEPIRAFLADCDALWLCIDAAIIDQPALLLQRQQEIEQIVEDYLSTAPFHDLHRPMALVLTKADLLSTAGNRENWTDHVPMARHALNAHCQNGGEFAVSSLGRSSPEPKGTPQAPGAWIEPVNLDQPLIWLAKELQAQDEARLAKLWSLAPNKAKLLQRAGAVVARRYADSSELAKHRVRLRDLTRRRRRSRLLAVAGTAATVVGGLWTYDAVAHARTIEFEKHHADAPAEVLQTWNSYRNWHPTRYLFSPTAKREEEQRLSVLTAQARQKEIEDGLAAWRKHAADPDSDPDKAWQELAALRASYPEAAIDSDLQKLRDGVQTRRQQQLEKRAQRAYVEMVSAEGSRLDLPALRDRADRFLQEYAGTAYEADVRRRRDAIQSRLESNELQAARVYSAEHPLNFQTRKEYYQAYLDNHPNGALRSESQEALRTIDGEWDKYDFRAVRDRYTARPEDLQDLTSRCQYYLAVHPQGRFAASAKELLRWCEQVGDTRDYKVVLKSGQFNRRVAFWLSRGPDLSVEIEVGGIRYGPSPIIANRYDPEWNYEFPRKIRWKLGDSIRIRVFDHDYWKHLVVFVDSDNDPLAMRLLSGVVDTGKNVVTFESDFAMPTLPRIED